MTERSASDTYLKELEELKMRIDCITAKYTAELARKAEESKTSSDGDNKKDEEDGSKKVESGTSAKDEDSSNKKVDEESIKNRVWRKVKLEFPTLKLTNEVEFQEWLVHLKAAVSAADVQDLFFDSAAPIVNEEDVHYRNVMAVSLLTSRLDAEHLEVINATDGDTPKELLKRLKEYQLPQTDADAVAAWLKLSVWRYDGDLSVSKNIAIFEKIIMSYNECGENLSNRMQRDIFVTGLPNQSRKAIMQHLRTTNKASFKDAVKLFRQLEKERENNSLSTKAVALSAHQSNRKNDHRSSKHRSHRSPSRSHTSSRRTVHHKSPDRHRTGYHKSHESKQKFLELCYKCKRPGHKAFECKARVCHVCGDADHSAAQCPRILKPKGEKRSHSTKKDPKSPPAKQVKKAQAQAMIAGSEASASDSDHSFVL